MIRLCRMLMQIVCAGATNVQSPTIDSTLTSGCFTTSESLHMGVREYRFVRRYLERCPQAPLSLQQVDPLIRELVQDRDFINYRPKEMEE